MQCFYSFRWSRLSKLNQKFGEHFIENILKNTITSVQEGGLNDCKSVSPADVQMDQTTGDLWVFVC